MPYYNIEKIKFGTDERTFERAVGLYESGAVTKFQQTGSGFSAVVLGTKPYEVSVSVHDYDRGSCACYLGEHNTLCKHMVAVAIYAATGGKALAEEDKHIISEPVCSGTAGELDAEELSAAKRSITAALRCIKPYSGPSSTWFANQDSLAEGCRRLVAVFSKMPVSKQTARLVVGALLRLEKKLIRGGVDDSNGIVGNCIVKTVEMLGEFADLDPRCIDTFATLENLSTSFGWEEPLVERYRKHRK